MGAVASLPETDPGGSRLSLASPWFREQAGEFAARASIAGLFVVLATRIATEFVDTGHVTGLLLLVSELLVVVLTVLRRRAVVVDRSWAARVVAAASMVFVPLIKPAGTPLAPDLATACVSGLGLSVIIAGKLALGRSFGLMPANRGIVSKGIYRVLRHPIYAGYLVTHAAFLAAHPSPLNLLLLVVSDVSLLVRATFEERTLALDPAYRDYMDRVRWRMVPGLF
jgi:protein-S-isoprenylcysteine O-methyltransferase Ste14